MGETQRLLLLKRGRYCYEERMALSYAPVVAGSFYRLHCRLYCRTHRGNHYGKVRNVTASHVSQSGMVCCAHRGRISHISARLFRPFSLRFDMNAQRTQLWFALVCLALGASMLHYRVHPPQDLTHVWATAFCLVDLILVSILFCFKSTAVWALLLNGFIAFLGIILMSDLSIVATYAGSIKVSPREAPFQWLLQTTFPDIAILVADFLVGLALYRVIMARENVR